MTFIVQNPNPTGLVASVGHTRALQPHEIGTANQAIEVAQTIRRMVEELKAQHEISDEKDVKLVLIKCPLLTSAKIAAIKAQDLKSITEDTYESMAKSRYASAIGIALGLDEMNEQDVTGFMDGKAKEFYSDKASCSSGAELEDCHILILASTPPTQRATVPDDLRTPKLYAMAGSMIDAIDAGAIMDMLEEIKKRRGHSPPPAQSPLRHRRRAFYRAVEQLISSTSPSSPKKSQYLRTSSQPPQRRPRLLAIPRNLPLPG